MTIVVFVGPTLSREEVLAILPAARVCPPAMRGDVYRWTRGSTRAIVIIDGEGQPHLPVWHKEVLWALARGVRVYGAGGLGALRAAELADFGMVGAGRVFELLRDGTLEDDDEVAVMHGTAEQGYRVESDAMVNIRATLDAAVAAGVISRDTAAKAREAAKALPYARRRLVDVIAAQQGDRSVGEEARLRAWLDSRGGVVDQKREDALELLRLVASDTRSGVGTLPPPFEFSYTETWRELVRCQRGDGEDEASQNGNVVPIADDVLEELQLLGREHFASMWQRALVRALGKRLAEAAGIAPSNEVVRDALQRFRVEHGLSEDPDRFAAWLEGEHVDAVRFEKILRDELAAAQVAGMLKSEVVSELMDVLRLAGRLGTLAVRAERKSALLDAAERPTVRIDRQRLVAEHFAARHESPPEDLGSYATALGFNDEEELVTAMARERWFRSQGGE